MATEFTMPKLGLTMEEATIIEWLVADGADVPEGAAVMRIETDKTETEVEIGVAGVLHRVGKAGRGLSVRCRDRVRAGARRGGTLGCCCGTSRRVSSPSVAAPAIRPSEVGSVTASVRRSPVGWLPRRTRGDWPPSAASTSAPSPAPDPERGSSVEDLDGHRAGVRTAVQRRRQRCRSEPRRPARRRSRRCARRSHRGARSRVRAWPFTSVTLLAAPNASHRGAGDAGGARRAVVADSNDHDPDERHARNDRQADARVAARDGAAHADDGCRHGRRRRRSSTSQSGRSRARVSRTTSLPPLRVRWCSIRTSTRR